MKLRTSILISLLAVAMALPAVAGNIIRNGDFEEGPADENGWPGWHTAIMGFMPKAVDEDEQGKIFNYICSCGHNFGMFKPQAGEVCPECGRFSIAEENGDWYDKNNEYVKLGPGVHGKGVEMILPYEVGIMQGTRCVSDLVDVVPGWPYRFSVVAKSKNGAALMAWVEGYKWVKGAYSSRYTDEGVTTKEDYGYVDDEEDEEAEDNADAEKSDSEESQGDRHLEKCYRAQLEIGSPGGWKTTSRIFLPPPRYKMDKILVKLYAFYPTEATPAGPITARFDHVIVEPLSREEAIKYLKNRKQKKDKRFR